MYPTIVKENSYGKCLVTTRDLSKGISVVKFDGEVIKYKFDKENPIPAEISDEDICYFLIVDKETAIIPRTNARYVNHSCDPNCDFNMNMELVTMRDVKAGEEITFSYNEMYKNDEPGKWDSRWTFKCQCGSPICQGMIDKYVYRENNQWMPFIKSRSRGTTCRRNT